MTIRETGVFDSAPIPPTWEEHLLAAPRSGSLNCLEFGVGDGRAACWLLDNLLVLEDDRYFGLDRPVGEQARRNLSRFGEKSRVHDLPARTFSAIWMWWPGEWPLRDFDVVHVSAHDEKTCWDYTRVAWFVLRSGGALIWDNCYPRRGAGYAAVAETFLEGLSGQWKVMFRKVQLAIRKTAGESSTSSPESALPSESLSR